MRVNLCKPDTHKGKRPAELIGGWVKVRPFYHVPDDVGSGFTSVRSKCTYRATVVAALGDDSVIVEMVSSDGPWKRKASYFPHELHKGSCRCTACIGRGINKPHGA